MKSRKPAKQSTKKSPPKAAKGSDVTVHITGDNSGLLRALRESRAAMKATARDMKRSAREVAIAFDRIRIAQARIVKVLRK